MDMLDREKLLKRFNGGPFGFGDPDDRELLPVERVRMIPIYQRDILLQSYCSKMNDEYNACLMNNSWFKKFYCRRENSLLKSCLKEYWDLPHLKEQAEEEYLKERHIYRLTGLKKSERDSLNKSEFKREEN